MFRNQMGSGQKTYTNDPLKIGTVEVTCDNILIIKIVVMM